MNDSEIIWELMQTIRKTLYELFDYNLVNATTILQDALTKYEEYKRIA